jgi:hypothetical protein
MFEAFGCYSQIVVRVQLTSPSHDTRIHFTLRSVESCVLFIKTVWRSPLCGVNVGEMYSFGSAICQTRWVLHHPVHDFIKDGNRSVNDISATHHVRITDIAPTFPTTRRRKCTPSPSTSMWPVDCIRCQAHHPIYVHLARAVELGAEAERLEQERLRTRTIGCLRTRSRRDGSRRFS